MPKLYFVCLIHNKIKVGDVWKKYWRNVLRVLRKKNGKMVVSVCDECQAMYPYFG